MAVSTVLLTTIILISFFTFSSEARIVRHTFVVSYIRGAPDGVFVDHIIGINGKFPGPTIDAEEGDTLEVTVINNLQDGENTTLHWHGFHQKGSQFEDGPAMITQCPLKHGSSQVYKFLLDQPGTYWYHSHVKSQYTAGLWGVIIVHPKPENELYHYDDEIVIALSDWYHNNFHVNEDWYLQPRSEGPPPIPDTSLINGMGRYPCPTAQRKGLQCRGSKQRRPVFKVAPGKMYRVRVISASGYPGFDFSIDGHELNTIEVDSVDLKNPVPAGVTLVDAGQRYSFLLNTTSGFHGSRFLIRSRTRTDRMLPSRNNINPNPEVIQGKFNSVTAILEYDATVTEAIVTSERFDYIPHVPQPLRNRTRLNERLLEALEDNDYPRDEMISTRMTQMLTVGRNADGVIHLSFNNTPFVLPEHRLPLLARVAFGDNSVFHDPNLKVWEISLNTGIELVINNPLNAPHPMHLHGHHFWVVNLGDKDAGNYSTVLHAKNAVHRLKRDTVTVPPRSYVVLRWMADNPGFWTFHCHIDWHMVAGMILNFVEGIEYLKESLPISPDVIRVCDEHLKFSNVTTNM